MKILNGAIPTLLIGGTALAISTHALTAEAIAFGADDRPNRTISIRDLDLGEPSRLPILYSRVPLRWGLQSVADLPLRREIESLHRYRRAAHVAREPFKLLSLLGFYADPRM